MNLETIRQRLNGASGRTYWRSLEEIAETPEFEAFLEDEFPNRLPDWADRSRRREFLKVMAASLALAGLGACTKQPRESIVPYVNQPEGLVPGKPLYYATAFQQAGLAQGILVESHLGRPTKIEGNPNHPASLGGCDRFALASILNLYDPDRSQVVIRRGSIAGWIAFVGAVSAELTAAKEQQGAGLRILTGIVSSPTLTAQIKSLLSTLPQARWHQFDSAVSGGALEGSRQAFGRSVNTVYHFDRASRIVSLDADFLDCGSASVRYSRDYARQRLAGQTRLYVAEGTPSVTGGMADHRFRMRTGDVEDFAWALAAALGIHTSAPPSSPVPAATIAAIAQDLREHSGSALIVPGDYQSATVHALAHAMNSSLNAVGQAVTYTDPVVAEPVDPTQSLRDLSRDMQMGRVTTLLILGGNPVYEAPKSVGFADALGKVKFRAHLSAYHDETSELCHWHIPESHYLETWSDARAFDGTVTISQPLLAPIYGSKSIHEVLAVLGGFPDRSSHDIVKDYWRAMHPAKDFEDFWQTSLHDGVVAGTALPTTATPVAKPVVGGERRRSPGIEVVFRPDPSIGTGLFSNNGWLQELPKPQSKMTWENAIWMSPATAQRLNLSNRDVVELKVDNNHITGPVWILPGHANESLTIHLGYGRSRAGHVGNGIGFNANLVRRIDSPWNDGGAEVRRVSGNHEFASTQHTQTMEERSPVHLTTLQALQENHAPAHSGGHASAEISLFPQYPYNGHKWGMAIDLNACVGCHACAVACQAENNIPVVGRVETAKGRHMNWLRVDRYYSGSLDDPETYFQPVPCMQCENAPCELVCPVGATVHSGDGLNQMIYNRCVGTRYCSNNCPYKVRRFNFYLYSDWYTKSLYGVRNPEVSVRSRGVMEKCTYCIQRITRVHIETEKEDRAIRDGEILTACQQACPTQAIVFGDLNDPGSLVSKLKADPRNYSLLEDLNTRPRTTYLARVRNPNPALEKG